MEQLGKWAFIVGVAIAIIAGLVPQLQNLQWVTWLLVVLGLIVGFLNVTDKETTGFLIATIALMAVGNSGLGVFGTLGSVLASILNNIVAFVAPGALVVALKAVYAISSDR